MSNTTYLAILLATFAQFVVGAIWYMPIFGKLWGQIHGFDKVSAKDQKEMMSTMLPMLGVQLIFTAVTTTILVIINGLVPSYSPYAISLLVWLGFFVPTQVSAVLFGGTAPKWVTTKIAIMAGGSLACVLVAAMVFSLLKV